jgi:nitrate reductase gamma subunit
VLGLIGLLLIIFGVGYLVYALAMALTPALGVAGGAAVTGGIIVGPIFLWAIIILLLRRTPPPAKAAQTQASNGLWLALFAAIAKETPWIAIVGAGLMAAAEMFLTRRRSK